jgi:hypothetical protein
MNAMQGTAAVAFCARPLVQRVYQALVVALAVFILTLVVFKQAFRGYLAEVRLSGPVSEGLDLEEAARWIKQVDRQVAAVANLPRGELNRGQLRITHVADHGPLAAARVQQLAERWLYQYLPDRLQNYRQAALVGLRTAATTARQREDAAHQELEVLRQRQLAQIRRQIEMIASLASASGPQSAAPRAAAALDGDVREEKLSELRRQLGTLAGQCTDDHPQVKTLRSDIAALEEQLAGAVSGIRPPEHYVSLSGNKPAFTKPLEAQVTQAEDAELLANQLVKALADLSRATIGRQEAEAQLAERMHELANRASGVQWTKLPPVVSRLGGTPRCSTLTLAFALALVGGTVIFRAAGRQGCAAAMQTTAELASAVELPVVGNLAGLAGKRRRRPWQLLSGQRISAVVQGGEAVLVVAVAACLLSIAVEPSLAAQVMADPFGALSEVLGRFGV